MGVCVDTDFNSTVCAKFEAALGTLSPLNSGLTAVSGNFGPLQGMIPFVAYTFQPNYFNFSTNTSGAAYIRLIVINP